MEHWDYNNSGREKMKNILLLAYTNFNFGDDMFIYTLCKKFPKYQFVLHASKEYKNTFSQLSNLTITDNNLLEKIYNIILGRFPSLYRYNINTIRYSAVVYVIGGLFDEDETWNTLVERNGLRKVKNMILKNSYDSKTPFFLLGCNMTRVFTSDYIKQMNFLFDGLTDICFRDKYSYSFFKNLNNVRYAPDIVFNYECQSMIKNNNIVISVWGPLTRVDSFPQWTWANELWEPYEKFLIEIIKEFTARGHNVTLLALCENEGDVDACLKINSDGQLQTNIVTYNGNLQEIINLFAQARFVVGTRFHSVVMALNSNCAFYPIIYESKTLQLLKDIGYHDYYSHIEQLESYCVNNVLDTYEKNNRISCEYMKYKASEQFLKLKSILKDK